MRLIIPCPHGYHGEHFLHPKWPEVGWTKCEPVVATNATDAIALLISSGHAPGMREALTAQLCPTCGYHSGRHQFDCTDNQGGLDAV